MRPRSGTHDILKGGDSMTKFAISMRVSGPDRNDPVSIYHQAAHFYYAGERCLISIPTGPNSEQVLPAAGVVNLVFSVELFLKSIILLSGNRPQNTHKIKDLVRDCPADIIDKVKEEYESRTPTPNFQNIVEIVNEMFVQVRYQYEYDVDVMYEPNVVELARSLFAVCEQLHSKP
jgi:hypothetical protein